jgi:hypothetical protein
MRRKLIWVALCLVAGVVVAPVSYLALWSMRANFLGEYDELKKDCQRVWEQTITTAMEDAPGATLATIEARPPGNDYCGDFFGGLEVYRVAILNRSIGFGFVVFIGLLILRFVMFPFDEAPRWVEDA